VIASPPGLRVLGIDPGTHACGWGVVVSEGGGRFRSEGAGVVRARSGAPVEERLKDVAAGLRDVVARLRPAEAAIEEVFYGRDVRAAVRIGEGRGAALVVLAEAGVPVSGYANNAVKRSVTGSGRAGKPRVLSMVRAILRLDEAALGDAYDASDALALALCHLSARRSQPLRSTSGGPHRYPPRLAAAIEAARARERARG
jgi:crossover junction endodeoxyribonuclease RuvC